MKTNDKNTKDFFLDIFSESEAEKYSKKLAAFHIENVEQLYGALNPYLPQFSEKEIKTRGLTSSYAKVAQKAAKKEDKIRKLKKALKISTQKANLIMVSLENIDFPKQARKKNDSELSFGLYPSFFKTRSEFWSTATFRSLPSQFVLPDYKKMGPVFNQGSRGTCVANAYCSLFDYLTEDKTSRQFLYHQCKMVDGIKDKEGTYMYVPVKLMSSTGIVDYGIVNEKTWPYNPMPGRTMHQGPPPEVCYNDYRYYNTSFVGTRKQSVIDDIKHLLTGSNFHKPVPVVIGVTLFESFNNNYSQKTGWITMPLPGEYKTGGHAMIIVGYYDDKKVFLVRNSWSTAWAAANPYGYPGHALIPYEYIVNYAQSPCWTFLSLNNKKLSVPESQRLYNTHLQFNKEFSHKKSALKSAKSRSTRRYPRKSKNVRLRYFLLGIATSLLFVYYKEVIHFLQEFLKWLDKM